MNDNRKVLNSIVKILQHVRDKTQNHGLTGIIEWFKKFIESLDSYNDNPEYITELIINYINSINGYIESKISAEKIYDTLADIDQITNIQNINNIVVSGWIEFLIKKYKTLISDTETSDNDPPSEETGSPTHDPSEGTGSPSLVLENDPSEGTGSSTYIPSEKNDPPSEGSPTYVLPSEGTKNDPPSEEAGSSTNVPPSEGTKNDPPEQGAKDEPKKTNTTAFILRVVAITLLVIVAVLGIIFGIGMIIALIYAIRSEEREEKWSTKRVLGRTLLSFGYVAMYWSKYGIW